MRLRPTLIARPLSLLAVVAASVATISPAAAATQSLECGATVTSNTTLRNDVGPCSGPGLIITASGVTLDLNHHRVSGTLQPLPGMASNTANATGIAFMQTRGSTVMNGEVVGFADGVAINGGSGNRVVQLSLHDNIGRDSGDGVAVFGSDRNLIRQNRIVHNGQWSGVSLLGSDTHGSSYNVIADNMILDNNVPMFDDNGTPIDKRDIGIAVEGPGATNNQILRNTVSGSGTDGIQVFPACSQGYNVSGGCPGTVANDNNLIANNTVTHNGFGLPLNGALGDGIALLSMGPPVVKIPTHNTVRNNTTNGNQRNGISLGGGNGQELSMDAWTTGGENYGCFISADPDNPVVDTPNLCGVTDNTVSDNSSAGNGIDGIYIGPKSDRNTVVGNTTDRNGKDGIGIGLAVQYGEGQLPVVDAAGHLVTVPGSGAQDNRLDHNAGRGNARWDGADETPGCGTNRWGHDRFATVNQPCVH